MSAEFVDSNVLAYAYGDPDDPRSGIARDLVARLARERTGALSVQVMQELWVTLTRKVKPPADRAVARARLAALGTWDVYAPRSRDVIEATDVEERFGIHFWDAMILLAARRLGAVVVWSEDLSEGQEYDGVTVKSPFSASFR